MAPATRITLKKGRDNAIRRFHPWIFSGALERLSPEPERGEVVEVFAADGQYVASGYYSGEGSIAVKLLTWERQEIGQDFFTSMIRAAYEHRERIGLFADTGTDAFRLVNAEGDSLPGLVVDFYAGTAVLQCQSVGMAGFRPLIVEALCAVLGERLRAVFDKSADAERDAGGEEALRAKYLYGERGESLIHENGLRFHVDWEKGQKTGFFLDQRENRALVRRYAAGRSVLNAFCYTGGFSVYALAGGAKFVRSVDSSTGAIQLLGRNIETNFGEPAHEGIVADYLEYIRSAKDEFDLIVLDPPAFAKHRAAVEGAVKGYRSINLHAFQTIKRQGLLFTFSCSQLISSELFRQTVADAAYRAGRRVRVMHELHQAPCHPISLAHDEGDT